MRIYSRKEVLDEAKHLAAMLARTEEIERLKNSKSKSTKMKKSSSSSLALNDCKNRRSICRRITKQRR